MSWDGLPAAVGGGSDGGGGAVRMKASQTRRIHFGGKSCFKTDATINSYLNGNICYSFDSLKCDTNFIFKDV